MYFMLFTGLYLVIGNLLHRLVFPEKKPDIETYFQPGQEFYSKAEGARQRIVKQEGGFVYGHSELDPFAPGPPAHVHTDFDETFRIENGELSVWVDGVVKKLHPGEELHIPKGTPHKPFNETGETIRIKGTFVFPEKFAFYLQQVYGYIDDHKDFARSPKALFQIALFQQAGFDSYIADGPPVIVQKVIGLVANPVSRLLGLRSYYEAYDYRKAVKNSALAAGMEGSIPETSR